MAILRQSQSQWFQQGNDPPRHVTPCVLCILRKLLGRTAQSSHKCQRLQFQELSQFFDEIGDIVIFHHGFVQDAIGITEFFRVRPPIIQIVLGFQITVNKCRRYSGQIVSGSFAIRRTRIPVCFWQRQIPYAGKRIHDDNFWRRELPTQR